MNRTRTETNTIRAVTGFRDLLDMIIRQEKEMLSAINAELKHLPDGTLYMWHRHGIASKVSFSYRHDGINHGISRNKDLIYKLARKKYLTMIGAEMERDLTINSRIALDILKSKHHCSFEKEGIHLRKLLEEYAAAGLDIARITMTSEQYRWMHSAYDRNEMNPEELRFETYSGVRMRSKSERMIGNQLELYGIAYRYEQAVTLDVSWMDDGYGEALYSPKTYYPDFIIMTVRGDYVFWEHLGRVDLFRYRAHNMEKICAFRESGDIDCRHLILTFEEDLKKPETLDDVLRQVLNLYYGM